MKQVIWYLVLLVAVLLVLTTFCYTVDAGTGPLDSLRHYQRDMRRHLNVDTASSNYCTDAVAGTLIRESIMTLLPVIRGKKTTWSTATTYRQGTYSLDSAALGIAAVVWSLNDSLKSLVYVPKSKWYEMNHKSTSEKQDYLKRPSYYDYDDDNLYVFPVPTKAGDTLRISGWQHVAGLGAATDLSSIPQAYRPVILSYAVYLFARGKSKQNAEMFYRDLQFTITLANLALNSHGEGYAIPLPPK